MRYASLGQIPPKRHVQVRRNGDGSDGDSPLLVEEVMGYEGFSGNESILLHLQSPCRLDRVGAFRPIEREEWVPDAHVHRLADTNPVEGGGDPVSSRRLLMWNGDIEVSVAKPTEELDGFYRNGEGDEVIYVHRAARPTGSGSTPRSGGSRSTPRARSRLRTATATATASCSSTRRSHSATSIRPGSSRRSTRRASSR